MDSCRALPARRETLAAGDRDRLLERLRCHEKEWRRLGVVHLSLFGSMARDQATPQSDVDVAVELAPGTGYDQLFELRELLQRIVGRPVDVITYRGAARHPRLYRRLQSEAVRVA